MNNRFMAGTCLLVFLMLGVASATNGQVTTGTPPFGSFGGGPDVINLSNLNARLSVPVLRKAGRGMSFDFNLTYDSSVWYPLTSSGTTSWQDMTAATWGWTTSIPRIGRLVPESASYNLYLCPGGLSSYTIAYYSNWTYFDGFGTPHPFAGTTEVDTGCGGDGFSTSINSTATDGSGYTVSITGATLNSLIAADGAQITLSGVTLQDKNGNKITENTSGQYYDTLSSTTPVLTAETAWHPRATRSRRTLGLPQCPVGSCTSEASFSRFPTCRTPRHASSADLNLREPCDAWVLRRSRGVRYREDNPEAHVDATEGAYVCAR